VGLFQSAYRRNVNSHPNRSSFFDSLMKGHLNETGIFAASFVDSSSNRRTVFEQRINGTGTASG
jgi:hypothetical protein